MKQDLIKECRSFFSLLRHADACFDRPLNECLRAILNELTYYETNQLNEIELLNKSIHSNFALTFLSLSDKVFTLLFTFCFLT